MRKIYLLFLLIVACHLGAKSQVTADFTPATVLSGCPNPFLVIVDDNSSSMSGAITSLDWTLTGPTGFTPVMVSGNQISTPLTIPGNYTLSLTACAGAVCDTRTEAAYIEVFSEPTISYSIAPTTACVGELICFDGTVNPGCGADSVLVFDLGDGNVIMDMEDFCHTYSAGNYNNFVVSATNTCGCTTTETVVEPLTVVEEPIANFGTANNFSCTAPLNLTINNSSTASGSATYRWDVPGFVNNVTTTNLTQTFPVGSYDVQLIVTEPGACSDTLFLPNYIIVGNPSADFTSNVTSGCPGTAVSFSDLSTGNPIAWQWDIAGVGTYFTPNPTVVFPDPGNYNVVLTASYPGGCSDVVTMNNYVTIFDRPSPSFTVSDSFSCFSPFTVQYDATSTNSVGTFWTFPFGSPNTANGPGPHNVTYNNTGSYNVTMLDTSAQGCVAQTVFSQVVTVEDLSISIVSDTMDGCIPMDFTFAIGSTVPEPIVSYNWTLNGSDIGTSISDTVVAQYASVGCYDVVLSVSTVSGCAATDSVFEMICAGTPPVSSFDISPPEACFEYDEVDYFFTGSGADTVRWDFGDSSPFFYAGPNDSVIHTYSDDVGPYTVSMTPFQYGCPGDTIIYQDTILIKGPIAQFTNTIESCENWNTIVFTNTSVEYDSIFWHFGDTLAMGLDTSSAEMPSYTYPAIDGIETYQVYLEAYNDTNNCSHNDTLLIQVFPPNADFIYSDSAGCSPLSVDFANTSFFIGAGINTRWNWDSTYLFASPAPIGPVWNGQPNRNRIYTDPGVYSVIMINQDINGCWDTIARPDLITVHGIFGGFVADTTEGCGPLTINFQDTSFAPITGVESWSWDFGDLLALDDTSNLPNPSYTYTQQGLYTVTLTVTDSFGCVETVVYPNYITVRRPVASFSVSDTFLCNNQSLNIINSSIGFGLTYDWQFPGATPPSYNLNGNPGSVSFTSEGVYPLTTTVTDDFGCVDDTTITVDIFDVQAIGSASQDYVFCPSPPLLVNFTNNSINNIDSNSVIWDFGDGSAPATDFNASTVYDIAGEYVVTLVISSLTGCTDTAIVDTIVIDGPYGEIDLLDPTDLCVCEPMTFAIKTVNAVSPVLLPGDGSSVMFNPIGLPNDTVYDTLVVNYCDIGTFAPSLFFNQGGCSYELPSNDTISVDSLVIDFGFSTAGICDTGTVCFFDSSYSELAGASDIVSRLWDFGDGATTMDTSSLLNPCYTYTAPGNYPVSLILENSNGCLDTLIQDVYIVSSPSVMIAQSDSNGCANVQVDFFDSTLVDSQAMLVSWHWDFGDPTLTTDTANTQNSGFTFVGLGVYEVTLEVNDNFGCSAIDSVPIEVFALPSVVAGMDTGLCIGDSVQLNASGAVSYVWLNNYLLSNDSIANPFSSAVVDTTYIVEGTDANGCRNTDSLFVDVSTILADFTVDTACVDDMATFTDLTVSQGGIVTDWLWNFDDPTSGVDSVSILQNPTHVFSNFGVFDILLTATDNNGCVDDTLIASTVQQPPFASFLDDTVCIGEAVSFNSSASNGGDGSIVGYFWDFGDMTVTDDTSNVANPSYTYSAAGAYTVCLTVISDLNCIGNEKDTCIVIDVFGLPTAAFVGDDACVGLENVFTDNSVMGALPITESVWDFGQLPGDTLSIAVSPADTSFTYLSAGSYFVTLTTTDDFGCSSSVTETVNVYENPTASFTSMTLCQNANNDFLSTSVIAIDSINTMLVGFDWDFDEGAGFISGDTLQTTFIANSGPHDVSLIVTDNFGCVDTVTNTVVVEDAPNARIGINDSIICRGEQINLNSFTSQIATPGFTASWDFDYNTGFDDFNYNPTHIPNMDVLVMLEVIDDNGCIDTAFQSVDILDNPTAAFDWQPACEDIVFNITSTTTPGDAPVVSWNWSVDSIPSLVGENVSYVSADGDTTLEVRLDVVDANGCSDAQILFVYVEEQPILDLLVSDTLICPGDVVAYNLDNPSQFTSTGVESLVWSPVAGIDNPTGDSVNISPEFSTTYTVSAFGTNSVCPPDDDNMVSIEVVPEPFVNVSAVPNPVIIGAESEISLSVVPFDFNSDQIIWNDTSNTLFPLAGGQVTATPTQETVYPVTIFYGFDTVNCQIDTSVRIEIIDECNGDLIYAPNIFTPNGDGNNDEFKLAGYGLSVVTSLKVFDRWGKMVYNGSNISMLGGRMESGWDGSNANDRSLNSAVFVYSYEAICANGAIVKGSGNITVIK